MGVKQLLKDYEDRFPDGTIPAISLVIVNPSDRSFESVIKRLTTHLETGFTDTDLPDTADVRYRVRQWKQLCVELSGLSTQQLQLRKYKSEETTQPQSADAQSTTADSQARRQRTCVAKGSMTAYTLPAGSVAIVLRRAPLATTNASDRYRGSFEVFFADSMTNFYTGKLKPLGWRCPRDSPSRGRRSTQPRRSK
jgi:hypothetical protein